MIAGQGSLPIAEVCAQLKKSGYAESQKLRIYGEEFEILSDPFPNEIGIAIRVRSRRTLQIRHLPLPITLVQGAPGRGGLHETSNMIQIAFSGDVGHRLLGRLRRD